MGPDAKPKHVGRVRRTSAVVRAWDGPNSRIAFEMDLDQMPWGPFEALGKKVTVLIPEGADAQPAERESTADRMEESDLERALQHVEHAAEKCAEFAQLGNGTDQGWSRSLETWEWLRNYLTSRWMAVEPGEGTDTPEGPKPTDRPLPGMPGTAATLEVAAKALRNTPLAAWREVVGAFHPDAPTREEAIQTILGVAKLLTQVAAPQAASSEPHPLSESLPDGADTSRAPAKEPTERPREARQEASSHGLESSGPDEAELSFDYAAGFDEGYQMGRKVGLALGTRSRSD